MEMRRLAKEKSRISNLSSSLSEGALSSSLAQSSSSGMPYKAKFGVLCNDRCPENFSTDSKKFREHTCLLAASTDSTTKDSSNSSERSDKLKRREEALLEMRHGWTKALNERIADKENRIQSQVRR